MQRLIKLSCFTVWGLFAGYFMYLLLGGPGTENIVLQASLSLIGLGISAFFYAVYINVKGIRRYTTLIPIFLGVYYILVLV
jgi:hypothetical protein